MKILTVIGARPQFIKAAVVSHEISRHQDLQEVLVHTGQHFDANMSQVFFDQLGMKAPAYNLGIRNATHGAMTGRMLESIERVMLDEKPHWTLVYGDTNSTLAGALAASKLGIPVAHVEAGLRSFNMNMPEEINRILTDRISSLLCCPTETAVKNLNQEGFPNFSCRIVNTGDVMKDVAEHYREKAIPPSADIPDTFFLATLHRAENTDKEERLRSVFEAFEKLSHRQTLLLPLHPRTAQYLKTWNIPVPEGVHILEPVGFLEMIYLISKCTLVLTDSGGVQKEAFFHHKPCVTLRDETEWTELVTHGYNVIAGTQSRDILDAVDKQLKIALSYQHTFYGRGDASQKIVALLKS